MISIFKYQKKVPSYYGLCGFVALEVVIAANDGVMRMSHHANNIGQQRLPGGYKLVSVKKYPGILPCNIKMIGDLNG